jgi:hypothetical protein
MQSEINFENYKEVYAKVKVITAKTKEMLSVKVREFKKNHSIVGEKETSGNTIFLFYLE